ncbi:MAG: GldG family protein, partial [Desulfobacterales bacterium]|nr:GldG family protein [Desulfobacterales bacterium]
MKGVAGILGLISFFLAITVRLILPELTVSVTGLLILGIVLLLICLFGSRLEIKRFLLSYRGKYSLNTTVMILIFIIIIILINFAGVFQSFRLDTTATGQFTLSPQTKNVIQKISRDIEAIGFFPGSIHYASTRKQAKYLLEEYRYLNKNIRFKFIDPEIRPAIARQYRVRQNGTVVFTDGERNKMVTLISELAFTNAILQVMGSNAKKVFFLTGHGERNIFSFENTGFSFVKAGLNRDLYEVKLLNLAKTGTVPADCAVLIIAGPTASIPESELNAIRKYVKHNGKLLLLADPGSADTIRGLLAEWGLGVSSGKVIDNASYVVPDRNTPAVFRGNYPPVIITRALDTSYFPEAAPIRLTDELTRMVAAENVSGKTRENWPVATIEHKNLVILPALLTSK